MDEIVIHSFEQLNKAINSKPLQERFKGIDPFDGLTSSLIKKTALGKNRLIRLAFVQFFKRFPFNLRPIFGINPEENPQALAVFLSANCRLYNDQQSPERLELINFLSERICELKEIGWSGACWSYPFAWQARAFYQPVKTPLIIPTAYCANALIDAYTVTENRKYLDTALSVGDFIINDLNRSYIGDSFAFSYSPKDKSVVYNATLMASQVLARIYSINRDENLRKMAKKSVQYCLGKQRSDGSWTYGKETYHQWIDSFHTGYVLSCLKDYSTYCDDDSVRANIDKGFEYYINTFFSSDGQCRYLSNSDYPLDMNNPAQLVLTLNKLAKLNLYRDLVQKVFHSTISSMQSPKGYFYYQKHRFYINKNIYLRWSNSWMFYALAILSADEKK